MVESRHRGRVVGLDRDGAVVLALGDITEPVYGRSANKPLQAMAMVERGLDLPPDLLALVCASHNGEPVHRAGVRRILASVGLDEGSLRNTPDLPLYQPSAHDVVRAGGGKAAILQNCSGKHAGMLATCVVNGWPLDDYLDPSHPLQAHVTSVIRRLAGEPVAHVGVDGCGAPAHAVSLAGLARALRHRGRLTPRHGGWAGRRGDARPPGHGRRERTRRDCAHRGRERPRRQGRGRGRLRRRARRRPRRGAQAHRRRPARSRPRSCWPRSTAWASRRAQWPTCERPPCSAVVCRSARCERRCRAERWHAVANATVRRWASPAGARRGCHAAR